MALSPLVGLIMGSKSDWETLKGAAETLDALGVPYEAKVVSAHRTPKRLYDYATSAKARGLKVIIAGAGGAAHLPGMAASMTPLPVLGVPVKSASLNGLDSLLSIVQMPKGVPVGTLAIGEAGAANAGLLAAAILALNDDALAAKLDAYRAAQTEAVGESPNLVMLKPGSTIGILGGGQLGRMLAHAAEQLGFDVCIYTDEPDSPAARVSAKTIVGDYRDSIALAAFAKTVDVVTTEFENVPAETAQALIDAGAIVRPSPSALAIAQDRFDEKSFFNAEGIATPPFAAIASQVDLDAALADMGAPAILKTRRLGYDGRGQIRIKTTADAAGAYEQLGAPGILEGFCPFEREVSIIAARGADGATAFYDLCENEHEGGILSRTTLPADTNADIELRAREAAQKVLEAFDYVGVLTIELFVMKDGALVANEMAPRVHNSGHWTIEGALTSQFEQHIRAIAGWPLGPTTRIADIEMLNLIGDDASAWPELAADPESRLHLYGKRDARTGRKMGHVTKLILR